jgi:hypothetical protein
VKHCKPPFVARDGSAACHSHTQCARHWRACSTCGTAAGRTVALAGVDVDPLRQAEALNLEKQRTRDAQRASAQTTLPLVVRGAK